MSEYIVFNNLPTDQHFVSTQYHAVQGTEDIQGRYDNTFWIYTVKTDPKAAAGSYF